MCSLRGNTRIARRHRPAPITGGEMVYPTHKSEPNPLPGFASRRDDDRERCRVIRVETRIPAVAGHDLVRPSCELGGDAGCASRQRHIPHYYRAVVEGDYAGRSASLTGAAYDVGREGDRLR